MCLFPSPSKVKICEGCNVRVTTSLVGLMASSRRLESGRVVKCKCGSSFLNALDRIPGLFIPISFLMHVSGARRYNLALERYCIIVSFLDDIGQLLSTLGNVSSCVSQSASYPATKSLENLVQRSTLAEEIYSLRLRVEGPSLVFLCLL